MENAIISPEPPISITAPAPAAPWSPAIPQRWMQDNLQFFGKYTLRELCIPGSHDAGMSTINAQTAFGVACNTITQTTDIGGQLAAGVRYFDLRLVISSGKSIGQNVFATGHYGYVSQLKSYQGATGQSFASIITQVHNFLTVNQELVILDLTHDLNTNASPYRSFTQQEWDSLLTQLYNGLINFLWRPPGGKPISDVDLSSYTLNDFICANGKPRGTVLILITPEMAGFSLGKNAQSGFYMSGMSMDYPTILNNLKLPPVPRPSMYRINLLNWFYSNSAGPRDVLNGMPDSELMGSAMLAIP